MKTGKIRKPRDWRCKESRKGGNGDSIEESSEGVELWRP